MATKYEEYQICKKRKHQGSTGITVGRVSWTTCDHCGTQYRYETKIIENGVPKDGE